MTRIRSADGFTLVEVLVAFVIAALALTAIYRAVSSGMLGSSRADEVAMIALEAQSKLAEIGVTIPLEAADSARPLDDAGKWTMRATPVDDLFGASNSNAVQLFDIELTGRTSSGREYTFRTYKLYRRPQQ